MIDARGPHLARYAKDFAQFFPDQPPAYLCPSCHTAWTLKHIEANPRIATKGHVIPESMGGRKTVIECRDCNNRHGHNGDFALVTMSKYAGFAKGSTALPAYIAVAGNRLPCDCKLDGNTHVVTVRSKSVTQEYALRVFDPLASGATDSIKITLPFPSWRRVLMGHLHAAHLSMFWHFGYRYRLSRIGNICVNILLETRWPDDLPSFTMHAEAINDVQLGDVFTCRLDDKVYYVVCTSSSYQQMFLTFLPSDDGTLCKSVITQDESHESTTLSVDMTKRSGVGHFTGR